MHESYKKWLDDGQPKVYCNCGCDEEIVIKDYYKWYGISKYILGHNNRKFPIPKSYVKWLKDGQPKIFCKCNCNKEIKIEEYHKYKGIPKYISGHNNRGKQFTEEHKQKIRVNQPNQSGENNWNYGNHLSDETKQKISDANSGENCYWFGKYSENHPGWKNANTPLNKLIRTQTKYGEWRLQIFDRDNFTCQHCGIRGNDLEAHHIKPFNKIIKEYNIKKIEDILNCNELWDLNNGITYCTKCHSKLKKRGGLL